MANTMKLARNETKPLAFNARKRIFISGTYPFKGEADEYVIYADQCIGIGGESQNYLAKRLSDGARVVAKIYDNYVDNPINRSNRRRVIQFLKAYSDYKNRHIMPLLDSGMFTIESKEESYDFHFPIDILPECTPLENYKVDFFELKEKFIPQLLTAVQCMHQENLVHRDIKPANLYLYQDELVLGDFGTSCEIMDANQSFYGTTQKRGTLGYTAPEVWQGYAVKASDYFALGCSIATLYLGEHVYQRLIDNKDEAALNKAINTNGLPLNCCEDDKDLQSLVDSLVLMDEEKRAGENEVLDWLRDSKSYSANCRVRQDEKTQSAIEPDFRFQFENTICTSTEELVQAMANDPVNAKAYLYRGGVQNSAIVNFYTNRNQAIAVKIAGIIEDPETAYAYDLGLAKCLHIMQGGGPFTWEGLQFKKLSDLAEVIANNKVDATYIEGLLLSGYLSWKVKEHNASEGVIEVVETIETLARTYPQLAMYLAMYRFDANKNHNEYHGAKSTDEIFIKLTKNPGIFYDFVKRQTSNKWSYRMFAYIAFCGYQEAVLRYLESNVEDINENAEHLYRLFEAICTDKKMVREHYYKYGPDSNLFWLKEHASLYHFHSQAARKLEENLKQFVFSGEQTIDQIAAKFVQMKNYKKDFLNKFEDNMLLAYMGYLADGEAEITSEYSDAYFTFFLGELVPVGYIRYIEKGA